MQRFAFVVLLTCIVRLSAGQCPSVVDGVAFPDLPLLTGSGPVGVGGDWNGVDSFGNTYAWNVCASESTYPNCGTTSGGVIMCQNGAASARSCGDTSTQQAVALAQNAGVSFLYSGGTASGACNGARSTNITVLCSAAAGSKTQVLGPVVESGPCSYTVLMSSPFACVAPAQQCPTSALGSVAAFPLLPKLLGSGPLPSGDWSADDSYGSNYTWNFCAPQSAVATCPADTAVCQTAAATFPRSCGSSAAVQVVALPNDAGVSFLYAQGTLGASCYNGVGGGRATNITVLCSPPGTRTTLLSAVSEPQFSCYYSIVMSSPFACPAPVQSSCLYLDLPTNQLVTQCVTGTCPSQSSAYSVLLQSTPTGSCPSA